MRRKAYLLKAGSTRRLRPATGALPPPAAGEVTVAIRAIGLNFADIFAIWGLYSATPAGHFVPGLEYAGEIAALGEGVSHLNVGDRVMGVTRFGAYATHLNIDHRYVLPLPEGWSFEEGAAYPVQVLTAWYGLVELGNLQRGQTVLIHSAAGGVGLWANRIARHFDAFTIGTVGHADKLPLLREEGYDRGIVRRPRSFREDLTEALGGRPLEIIMECIGGSVFRTGFDLLAPQGRQVVYGSARYGSTGSRPNYLRLLWLYLTRPKIDPQGLPEQNKSVMGFNLIWLYDRVTLMHDILHKIEPLDLGRPLVGHLFPFEALPEAIRLFQSGRTTGKVIVQVEAGGI